MIVNVSHDLQRQLLEMPSLLRVINNYYDKKIEIEEQIRPLILKKFKEGLKTVEENKDWLFSIPTALNTLSEDFLSKNDSFRFPDSIILFEAWLNLGMDALYPRFVIHFKFPGFLKGEKTRNVFQFIFSSSRGFGFPIYFGPEFYEYKPKFIKILDPILKWTYTLNHRANQGIYYAGDKKLGSKRHHPGEFESVIISEYKENVFKGIDTLLHGYYTNDPKYLGNFSSLEVTLQNVLFSYTIGDHAMSVDKRGMNSTKVLEVPVISHDTILKKFDIDFYAYIKKVMEVNKLLMRKIIYYKKKRKSLINQLKLFDKIQFRLEQSKQFTKKFAKIFAKMSEKLSQKYPEIDKYNHYKTIMEKLRELLFITPLYMHTVHTPKERDEFFKLSDQVKVDMDEFEQEYTNSILLLFIKSYEKEKEFTFEESDIIDALKNLRDHMAKMWLYFKERHFKYAVKKLNEITSLSINNPTYKEKVMENLEKLMPIISIYEIFHRPLSESVYPESNPQYRSQFTVALARFVTSKYNPIGFNIIKIFNRSAFRNWSYFVMKKNLNRKQFFELIVRLPIWKHIPSKVKMKILEHNSE